MRRTRVFAILAGVMLTVAACGEQNDDPVPPGADDDNGRSDSANSAAPTPEETTDEGLQLAEGFEEIRVEEIGSYSSRPHLPSEMRPPVFHVASDQDELETGWEMYELDGDFPDVEWESNAVLFMALSESGSCPWEFRGLSTDDHELFGHLVYDVDHPDDEPVDCTADDNPRTFVVAVDRNAVSPDEMIVRLVHDDFDYAPLRTDTRDMPLNSIDRSRQEYPFVVWESERSNGDVDRERIVEWVEVIALDESSIAMRFGFREQEMVPDVGNPNEFEILEPGPEYVHTVIGMAVRDAALGFPAPDMPDIYTAPYREIGVAGRDYHPMMVMASITLQPRAADVEEWDDVEIRVPLEPDTDALEWEASVVEAENTVELEVRYRSD